MSDIFDSATSGNRFLDQELISNRYLIILFNLVFVGRPLQKSTRLCHFKSDLD